MGMPAAVAWTVNDLETLPDDGRRYELVNGELLVTPAPSLRHQDVADELCARLRAYLRLEPVTFAVSAPADVRFNDRTSVQPDILALPLRAGKKPWTFAEAGRLLMAVEVLSRGTAARDRGTKRELYQREGVAEYWIIDPDARLIERWRPADARPEIIRDELNWLPEGAGEPFVLDVVGFFTKLQETQQSGNDVPA